VTRTVWDGDQILAEIRAPYTVAEQDLGPVPTVTVYRRGYGQVLYTHGPSLDYPIRVTRLSYDSIFPAPIYVTPHTNWQGSYDSGEVYYTDGGGSCKRVPSGVRDNELTGAGDPNGGGAESAPGSTIPDSVTACIQVDWPAPYQWQSKLEHGRSRIGPAAWMGSLIEGGRDLTAQLYMRNRFYDPQSGKFTQEDPIGIAGGLNVYGFAGGDPVNYSDPYGLCPEELVQEDGSCPGGWTHDEYNRIDQIAQNNLTAEASDEVRSMLAFGLIRYEATDADAIAETVPTTRSSYIRLAPIFFRMRHPGDAAQVLGHELGHVKQHQLSGLIYGERMDRATWLLKTSSPDFHQGDPLYDAMQSDADKYGCSVAIGVVGMRIAPEV
jgi:RHS repeat-associated protein